MSNFPVPWIEQLAKYNELRSELDRYKAQNTSVSIHSFNQPTQSEWESAWINQTGLLPPIAPGARLFWFDLKNGTPKAYTTSWLVTNQTIDPTVRPLTPTNAQRGCLRFLGHKQMYEGSIFVPSESPVRYTAYSLLFDLGLYIRKNLVGLIVFYRAYSPVLVSLFGNAVGAVDPYSAFGDFTKSYGVSLQRFSTTANSVFRVPSVSPLPANTFWYTAAGYTATDGTVPTLNTAERHIGYGLIFSPAAPFVNNEQQPGNNGLSYMGIAASITNQATPIQMWQSFAVKFDGSNLRDFRVGTPNSRGVIDESAYLYGIFSSDPGDLEIFS